LLAGNKVNGKVASRFMVARQVDQFLHDGNVPFASAVVTKSGASAAQGRISKRIQQTITSKSFNISRAPSPGFSTAPV